MCSPYVRLLPYAFRRFSLLSARRTLPATLRYYLQRTPLPASTRPALFTMNILPPMMTVWYHCARKYLGNSVDITIFDSSGYLQPEEFPDARVQKFLNVYAATKTDEFLYHIARHHRIGWMCDDDVFFIGGDPVGILTREFSIPSTASVSFRPRGWWHYVIDGTAYPASSSYCTAINREIYCERERLSLAPANGNVHPTTNGSPLPRRYDTFDKANEILLRKGYRCVVVPEKEQRQTIAAFSGLSGAVMLLWYFKKPEDTLAYFQAPSPKQWRGNMLFGLLSAMLAICTIQECSLLLRRKTRPLPSLPSRAELERLRKEKTPLLRNGTSFAWVDDVSERLRAAL